MNRFGRAVVAAALLLLALQGRAFGAVERFAVVVGNNQGDRADADLRYAERDAERIERILREVGAFAPTNVVLLRGSTEQVVRRSLVAMNDRIRAVTSVPGNQVMLFVYYSGHADAQALHLGASRLEISELEQMVRGSAATFRVLVLDACRSGSLTRVKGGTLAPPLTLKIDDSLAGEGVVFLTASAANEDAQESDELRSSFFTHHFASGLLGAADADGDGRVLLEEAYRHAYEGTIRATSRTWAGIQHPTFRYELRGQGKIVLSEPATAEGRGALTFASGKSYLAFEANAQGAVVGEVSALSRARRLSVPPGKYFLRGRGPDFLLEGEVMVRAGETVPIDEAPLRRIEYARLVRKGASGRGFAHGPSAGYFFHTPLPNAMTLCHGVWVGYGLALENLQLAARVAACRGGFSNAFLTAIVDEVGGEMRVAHAWDVTSRWTFDLAVAGGASTFVQRFDTAGVAPTRVSLAGTVSLGPSIALDLGAGFHLVGEAAGALYLLPLEARGVDPALAFRASIGLGKQW